MNSPIKLPEIPERVLVMANLWTAQELRDAIRAYAEQAVREALAALKIDEIEAFDIWAESKGLIQKKPHGMIWINSASNVAFEAWQARASLIPENPNVEGADIQHP
ncbi:hypothetical protein [Achromobacter ruhlandii]|uniref:hypothetical protein n=1 Tax=Achromobacter ruhlandii TaxID=72557 RepID=UPI003BA12311